MENNCKYCEFYLATYGHTGTPPSKPIPGTRACGHDIYVKGKDVVVDNVLEGISKTNHFPDQVEFKISKKESAHDDSYHWFHLEPLVDNRDINVAYIEKYYNGKARLIPTENGKFEIVIFGTNLKT